MRRTLFLWILLLPAVAAGEDEAPKRTPEEAFDAKRASLPEPGEEAGFDFMGVMRAGKEVVDGKLEGATRIGHARLRIAPAKSEDGTAIWEASEALVIKLSAVPRVDVATARLDRRLGLIDGTVRSTKPGAGGITWQKTGTGFSVSRKKTLAGGEPDTEVVTFEHAGGSINTLAATLFFMKHALPDAGKYAVDVLQPREALEDAKIVEPVAIEVVGEQEMPGGHKVYVVKAKRGDKELEALFDIKTRNPIGLSIAEPGRTLQILKGDKWSLPATTAKGAAMRAGFAFATGDLDVLDDVVHWQTLYKQALAARSAEEKKKPISIDEYRKRNMEALGKNLQKRPAEMIGPVLESMADQIKLEERKDGTMLATFPPLFQGMKVLLGEEAGIWYMFAMPTQG